MESSTTFLQTTTVTRKGQVTIPAPVRRALGLRRGDRLAVSLTAAPRQEVRLYKAPSVAEQTFGRVTPRRMPEDDRLLREQFVSYLGERIEHKEGARRDQ